MSNKDPAKEKEYKRIWYLKNKEHHKALQRKWNKDNKEWQREYDLKRKFGITSAEYNAMFSRQSGVCAICGKPEQNRNLFIDHDHKTGLIRGLLCNLCNFGIGYMRDDVSILARAIGYLDANAQEPR